MTPPPLVVVILLLFFVGRGDGAEPDLRPAPRVESSGEWGTLRVRPLRLTLPDDMLRLVTFPNAGQWVFVDTTWPEVRALLRTAGMAEVDLVGLAEPPVLQEDRAARRVVLHVPDVMRLRLGPVTRGEVYRALASVDENEAHLLPFMLPPEPVIDRANLNPALRERIRQLQFQRGRRRSLVDADLLSPLVRDADELLSLKRVLNQHASLQVELTRASLAQRERVAAYWSRPGGKPVEQWLDRFERSPTLESIDVSHLLPALPQRLLNTFPDGVDSPEDANCFWTALNFGREETNDAVLPPQEEGDDPEAEAVRELRSHYERTTDAYRFGDVIAFYWVRPDHRASLIHVVVHMADGIVLTKNGVGRISPFVFARYEDVFDYYDWTHELKVLSYRPKRGSVAWPVE